MPSCTCTCGARYRFREESVGHKAKCKKCGEVFTLDAPETGVIPIADEGVIPFAKDDPMRDPVAVASGTASDTPFSVAAADVDLPPPPPGFIPPKVIIEAPERERTYTGDLIESLVFMFRLENLPTFAIMWFILVIGLLILPFAGLLGALGMFIVVGWYSAFRFDVVRESAAGESCLPELTMSEGWFDGIVFPFFAWVGSWLIVMIPAIVGWGLDVGFANIGLFDVLLLITGDVSGQVVSAVQNQSWMFLSGLVLGLFFWPMIVLCFALGGVSSLGRLDLIVETTLKTVPVYLLTVLIMYATVAAEPLLEQLSGGMLAAVLIIGLSLYLELIALRAIGLYYHHFKDRFAWSWG